MKRRHAYWVCQVAGWATYSLLSLGVVGLQVGYSWSLLARSLVPIALGMALTHGYRAFVRRRQWLDLSLVRLVPRVLGATGALAVVFTAGSRAAVHVGLFEPLVVGEADFWSFDQWVLQIFGLSIVLLLWSLIYFGVHYLWSYRQAEVDKWKLEAQAKAAHLRALKLQLDPHFFFNSLNSVRALTVEDPERAQDMVTRLARLLRSTLQADEAKTVPLHEEIEAVRAYLELEEVRLEDRLHYRIDVSEAAADCPVPFLVIQTLVENAITHGVADRPEGGHVAVEARINEARATPSGATPSGANGAQASAARAGGTGNEAAGHEAAGDEAAGDEPAGDGAAGDGAAGDGAAGGRVVITVENTGTLDADAEEGIGLRNARERLQLLFGDDASLTLEAPSGSRVRATVELPPDCPPTMDPSDLPADRIPNPQDGRGPAA
jgi:hypothetical protein